jgi:hypothetical protein
MLGNSSDYRLKRCNIVSLNELRKNSKNFQNIPFFGLTPIALLPKCARIPVQRVRECCPKLLNGEPFTKGINLAQSLFSLVLFTTTLLNAEQFAFDIFVESCRNSGENSNLIRSGYAEFGCMVTRQFPSETIQRVVEGFEATVKADSDKVPADVVKMRLESIQRITREMAGKEDSRARCKLLFTGNDVLFALNADVCKRYRAIEQYDVDHEKWQLGEFTIMDGSPNGGSVSAGFEPGTMTAMVQAKIYLGYEFQRFGRM